MPKRVAAPMSRVKPVAVARDAPDSNRDLRLPHERDEAPDLRATDPRVQRGSRKLIRQAARDVYRGLVRSPTARD